MIKKVSMIEKIQIFLLFALVDFLDFESIHNTYLLNRYWKVLYSKYPKLIENRLLLFITTSKYDYQYCNQFMKIENRSKQISLKHYEMKGLLSLCSNVYIQRSYRQDDNGASIVGGIVSQLKCIKHIDLNIGKALDYTFYSDLASILNTIPVRLILSEVDRMNASISIQNITSLHLGKTRFSEAWTHSIDTSHITDMNIIMDANTNDSECFTNFMNKVETQLLSFSLCTWVDVWINPSNDSTKIFKTLDTYSYLFTSIERMKSLKRLHLDLNECSPELKQFAFEHLPESIEHLSILNIDVSILIHPMSTILSLTIESYEINCRGDLLGNIFPNLQHLIILTGPLNIESNKRLSTKLDRFKYLKTITISTNQTMSVQSFMHFVKSL